MFVPLRGTPRWRFHTELCKFQSNVSADNSTTEYRTDLRSCLLVYPLTLQILGFFHQSVLILIFYGVTVKIKNTYSI